MRRPGLFLLALILAFGELILLPYLGMGFHDVFYPSAGNGPRWATYALVTFFALLWFGAFFMMIRLFREPASISKPNGE
jgi:hypothetical protein